MKKIKLLHWIFTGLLSAMLLLSVGMYLFMADDVSVLFKSLGYPGYLVYPLGIAKLAAVVMLLTKFNKILTEWAYAGLAFTFSLAALAHLMVQDGEHMAPMGAFIVLIGSYVTLKMMALRK
jgi:hypothetical protein